MQRIVKTAAAVSTLAAGLFALWYRVFPTGAALSLTITAGTTAYHFIMRLLVGGTVERIMRGRADYGRWWYRPRSFEEPLYRALRVKQWKNRMPTWRPESFSLREHTPCEIAQTMCSSELVHEISAVLSFAPLLAARFFGALPVFLITSAAASLFDLMFAVMQRYNRPRILRLAGRRK